MLPFVSINGMQRSSSLVWIVRFGSKMSAISKQTTILSQLCECPDDHDLRTQLCGSDPQCVSSLKH